METKDRQTLTEESQNSECFPLIETMSTWTQAGRHQRQETLTNSNEPSKTSVVTGSENRSKRWWRTGESRIEIPKDSLIRDRFVASWTFPSLDEIYLHEREIEALPKQKNCTVSEFASSLLKKTEIKPEANRQQFSHPAPSVHSLNFFSKRRTRKRRQSLEKNEVMYELTEISPPKFCGNRSAAAEYDDAQNSPRAHAHTQNEIEETKTASGGGVTPGPPFETGGKSELKPTSLPGPPGWLRHRQISR